MIKKSIFTKTEKISLVIIFTILLLVSIPNFVSSLRRARDQVRRDDLGSLVHNLDNYFEELGVFPPSSVDGEIMDCLKDGDKPYQDDKGRWIIDPISCEWGKDSLSNLISGKIYISTLPRDPHWEEGRQYIYRGSNSYYQVFAALEGEKEPEYDPVVVDMGIQCGNELCNMARTYGCNIPKTIEQCEEEAKRVQL